MMPNLRELGQSFWKLPVNSLWNQNRPYRKDVRSLGSVGRRGGGPAPRLGPRVSTPWFEALSLQSILC
jgi:hypothetical protein